MTITKIRDGIEIIIHHNNCSYCSFRGTRPGTILVGKKKKRKKQKEIEFCIFHSHDIPTPFSGKPRYCENYAQNGCLCEKCANFRVVAIDNGVKL